MSFEEDIEQRAYAATLRGIKRAMGEAFSAPPSQPTTPRPVVRDDDQPNCAARVVDPARDDSDWVTVGGGIVAVIDAASGPLRVNEIFERLGPRANLMTIRSTLPRMVRDGRVIRVDVGLYASARSSAVSPLSGIDLLVYKAIEARPESTLLETLGHLASAGVEVAVTHLGRIVGGMRSAGRIKTDGAPHRFARYSVVEAS